MLQQLHVWTPYEASLLRRLLLWTTEEQTEHRTLAEHPMSTPPAADQDGGSSTPVVAVEPVSDTETAERSKKNERAAKVERVKVEPKLPKPPNASHPVWKHFRVYRNPCLSGIAICQLCVANGDFHCAETKFKGGSPTNLLAHLDTSKVGHRDAHTAIKHAKAKGSGSAAAPTGQAAITNFLPKEEGGAIWHDELVRLIVNNYLSLSVSFSCF